MSKATTVAEIYQVDVDALYALSEVNGYWSKCHYFYNEIMATPEQELTQKQRTWLDKISDDYEEAYEKNCG